MEEGVELFITSGQTFSFRNLPKPLLEVVRRQFGIVVGATVSNTDIMQNNNALHISINRYSEFIQVLRTKTEKISPIPNAVLVALERAQHVVLPSRETLLGWVSEKLLDSLYDYQKEGVAFAVARGGKCMIADEMGVGKSRQGIYKRGLEGVLQHPFRVFKGALMPLSGLALLASYKAEWPCLIIAPSSLTGQWRGLCLEWLTIDGLSEGDIRWVRKGSESLDGRINIISYDLAVNKEQELSVRNFQVILCDESHKLKSRTSRRTKALLPFLKNARRTILMSGTPALSRPAELFTQLSLLRPDIFHSFHEFGVRYCEGKKAHFGWQYEGASNLQELHIILETLCMIRRTKDEVLKKLPPKSRERVALTLAPEQVKLVDKSVEQLRKVTERAKEKFVDPITQKAAFLSVWRDTGRAKCPSIIEYIHHLLQQGEKFLVFAHHKFVLDELETFLSRNTTPFIRIDGTTPQNHRTRQADSFQDNPEIRVALLSIMAAGTGLTLTAANIVVFAELLFTPGDILQAEDRCHRISQVRPVSVRFLIAQGTPDERIWWMLNRKLQVLGNIYGKDKMALHATQTAFEDEVPDMRDFIAAILGHDVIDTSSDQLSEQQQPTWNSGLMRDRFTKASGSASNSTLAISEVVQPPKQEVITQFFEAAPEKKRRRVNPLQNTAPPAEMWGGGVGRPLKPPAE